MIGQDIEDFMLTDDIMNSIASTNCFFSAKDYIRENQIKTEEKCIIQVIESYTSKSFHLIDPKLIARWFHVDFHDKYILAYKGDQLGMVTYEWIGNIFTVTFSPGEITF